MKSASASASRGGRALLLGIAGVLVGAVGSLGFWMLRGGARGPLELFEEGVSEERVAAGELPGPEVSGETVAVGDTLEAVGRVALEAAPPSELGSHPPRTWRGRVQHRGTEAPIEGATVGLRWERQRVETQSDETGAFELLWRGPDGSDAQVVRPGFAPLHRPHVLLAEEALFELDHAGVIAGRVVGPGPDELPAARASLWDLGVDSGTRRDPVEAEVGEDGRFAFEDLAAGQYSVGVSVPGWSLVYESALLVEIGERVEVLFEPARGATLRGTVRTNRSRTPVVGATLTVEPERQGVSGTVENLGRLDGVTGADGSFTLEGLSVGMNDLELETAWGGRLRRQVPVADPGQWLGPVEYLVDEPASLAGSVVTAAGHGVGHARVQASWDGPVYSFDPDRPIDDHPGLLRTEADVNGRFRFDTLPAGRRIDLVAFRGEGGATTSALQAGLLGFRSGLTLGSGEKREGFELKLHEPLRLSGVVRDAKGRPVEDVRVTAQRNDRVSKSQLSRARTDEEGRFELVGLLPAAYRILWRHPDYLAGFDRVLLAPEVDRELELTLQPAYRISGWVVDEWGNGIPAARVHAVGKRLEVEPGRGASNPRDRTDAYGRFELEEIAPGDWELRFDAIGYERAAPEAVRVPGGEGIELVLRREAPLERVDLSGQAILPDGRAPTSLRVDNTRGGAMSQEGSRFRLSGVRPGSTRFTFLADGCVPQRIGPLELAPGTEVDLGVIEFQLAAEVTVFVRAKGGQGLSRFKARLLPLPPEQGGVGGRAFTLGQKKLKHRWSGGGPRQTVVAAHSPAVPLGRWRLVIDHAGYDRYQKSIQLGLDGRRRYLEAELSPKGSAKKAKQQQKKDKKSKKGGK